ncbi:MAG: tRNA (adenosine(37)-N6)-threonylcarbamoyltransferase complex ATPase subunit type 1 TsaE [Candidatus Pacebacteria bacterium]|nr:tRNA (adenosine(37)-N6)-threonylcarbamoyltransferase complex ATPase subunit type 1 TsaE [Candidatus Paceibacterota bacterium]
MKFLSQKPSETKKLGEKMAKRKADVLALKGELGAGKTTFLKGYAKGLGVKEKVLSPTFLILKKIPIKNNYFIHIDCYRIKDSKEILDLGFKKMLNKYIMAIEWPERIKNILPKDTLWINFKIIDKNKREITIK